MTNLIKAALGLGSNMGNTQANMTAAIRLLKEVDNLKLIDRSSDYRTPPWGPIPQDDYRNICVTIETSLSARDLLTHCLEIERALGRVRDIRWGPRLIDIDVLIYGFEQIDEKLLTVPHPRMAERAFVLVPLAEIWPTAPIGNGMTAQEALATCQGLEDIVKIDDTKPNQ
ncbi:MAG: 2-amino-4-hydroxy-6-hydroxymethyldihydropteridine diphosphokinase [Rhodobacteraceae bacterium]|nr:2-amino-4-hydroxy-6-hydroxymethyldihydropteridine diphosphokinase [Paracoccaceae bacterium]